MYQETVIAWSHAEYIVLYCSHQEEVHRRELIVVALYWHLMAAPMEHLLQTSSVHGSPRCTFAMTCITLLVQLLVQPLVQLLVKSQT